LNLLSSAGGIRLANVCMIEREKDQDKRSLCTSPKSKNIDKVEMPPKENATS